MAHQPVQTSNSTRYSKLENVAQLQQQQQQKPPRLRDRVWGGWRTTVSIGAIITFIALIVNIAILIWASKQKPPDTDTGVGVVTLYNESCSNVGRIFTWSHFGVNVVSTLLLSAGTACMQCLSAPTRQEIDAAHSQSTWLDVGIPSVRNLKWIARRRRVLWSLLGLSSLPLHLFYNSVIFSTTAANDYSVIMVADEFLHDGRWNASLDLSSGSGYYMDPINKTQIQHLQDNLASLVRLDNDDCFKAYQSTIISSYKDVLLVTGISNTTNAVLGFIQQLVNEPYAEEDTCVDSFTCWIGSQKNSTDWTFNLYPGNGFQASASATTVVELQSQYVVVPVNYCLAESSPPTCTISLSRVYLGVVILCNAVKLACIISTLTLTAYRPLVTVGDAIESFLTHPDLITKATSLSASEVRKQRTGSQWCASTAKPWFPFRHFWFEAASARRWASTILCLLLIWTAAVALLVKGATVSRRYPALWRNGFGVLDLDAILPFSESLDVTTDVLIVNFPQVLLSFTYLMCNGVLTCMLLSTETLAFASSRNTIRVSRPRGAQRSTYWLQLPYRYALPFLLAMGVLHWLVSQSLFLVRIAVIREDGARDREREINGCGWSPDALIATVVIGAVVVAALLACAARKLPGGMPIVSSCSAAISAACHRAESEAENMAVLPLKYGVTDGPAGRQVGFSAGDVQPLEEEVTYGRKGDRRADFGDAEDDYI